MINDIKRKIINEYETDRTMALARRDSFVKKVFEKYPEIDEFTKEINRLGLENTKNILRNPEKAKEYNSEFNKKLNSLVAKKEEFMKKNGIPAEYDKPHYKCALCQDTGYTEDGKKCRCYKDKIIKYTYKSSNLSEVMKGMSFENFSLDFYSSEKKDGFSERENMEYILKASKDFCNDFENRRNILFYGAPGLGKTFISVSIARKFIENEKTVIYISATKLFSGYDDYKFGRNSVFEDFLNDLYLADLLIIDDLGTEYISKLSVPFLFDLVNDRILKNKKIIINTNLEPNALENAYSLRFMSRIYEHFDVFKFRGKDIRIQQQYLK